MADLLGPVLDDFERIEDLINYAREHFAELFEDGQENRWR